MGTVNTRYSYTCGTHDRTYTATVYGALRQSKSYRRPPLPPLGLRWVLTCAHRARGLGPRGDLPAYRKRKRARAGRPMAARAPAAAGAGKEEVAHGPLRSPPRPPGGGCPCTKPAKGISKRGASAVGHEQREEEQERSPGRRPRGHRGRDCGEEGRWRKGSRRGHARRERRRRGRGPGPPPGSRTPLLGRGQRQVTARGLEKLRASTHRQQHSAP